jgi:hypothetical protein
VIARSARRSGREAVQPRPSNRSSVMPRQRRAGKADAHHHGRVGLDLTDGAELHLAREARDHTPELSAERQGRLAHAGDDEEQARGNEHRGQ